MFDNKVFRKYGAAKEINNRFFTSDNKKIIYCEVPKAGISTIKKTLVKILFDAKVDYNVHDRNKYPLKSPNQNNINLKEFNAAFKFTFIRNPYTRILSAYIDKIKNNKLEKKAILNFGNLKNNHDLSFIDFLKILEKIDPKTMNPHFRPQYLQIVYPVVDYDFIGRFEYFNEDLSKVLSILFDKNESNIIKVVHHQTNSSNKSILKKYYSSEEQCLVRRIFAQDFIYFQYSFEFF